MENGISGGLQHHYKTCCEKGGRCGRRACMVRKWFLPRGRCFQTGGLVYDTLLFLKSLFKYNLSSKLRS